MVNWLTRGDRRDIDVAEKKASLLVGQPMLDILRAGNREEHTIAFEHSQATADAEIRATVPREVAVADASWQLRVRGKDTREKLYYKRRNLLAAILEAQLEHQKTTLRGKNLRIHHFWREYGASIFVWPTNFQI